MSEDLKVEYILLQIRDKLNNDKIRLWLPPYHRDDNSKQEENDFEAFEKLADKYSADLNIDKKICITVLKELQKHALDKLNDKEVYLKTGVAVIKVKLSGFTPTDNINDDDNNKSSVSRILSIHISLTSLTEALQKEICDKINVPAERIKLIFNGKVLNKHLTLESQGLKHGLQIMAVIISANSSDLQEYEKQVETLERMKDDVSLLANSVGPDQETYLQVADQSGKTLDLPPEEQKALVTAMALHEKGRAALKKDEFALALVFLLEADKAFSNCNSQLLNSVDNYGLLNLDIAWCYLCLKNVTQLPDAEKRLKICESKFKYSYGPNLERLVALKGSSGNEAALLMRLHLLQGIVLFHQNRRHEALVILEEAQQELLSLQVDDGSLSTMIELGMTAAEARLALRVTKGCVTSAVEYIHRKRQEKEDIIKREKIEKQKRLLGLCKDGKQYVDPELVDKLECMGFPRSIAVEALRHTNNEIRDAISVIHQQPELLNSSSFSRIDSNLLLELTRQVAMMGYDVTVAKQALINHKGDIEKAVEDLLAHGGVIPVNENEQSTLNRKRQNCMTNLIATRAKLLDSLTKPANETSKIPPKKRNLSDENGGAGSTNDNQMPSSSTSMQNGEMFDVLGKRLKMEKEAFDRFSKDINTNVDDHLDLTLEQEEQFLTQYLSLLI